jgi:hypothetical protein
MGLMAHSWDHGGARHRFLSFVFVIAFPVSFGRCVPGGEFRLRVQLCVWLIPGEFRLNSQGDSSSKISSIGIDFESWDETHELLSDSVSGGAVFWMTPDDAMESINVGQVTGQRTVVIAQLTLATISATASSQTARFGAQGRTAAKGSDWEENCITVLLGGSQHGEVSALQAIE